MNQRTLLLLAAATTAFVLVVVGGVAARVSAATELAQRAAAFTPSGTLDPQAVASDQAREAAYQAALAEANRRLEQANHQLAQRSAAAAPATTAYAVTPAQAQTVALDAVPGAALLRPAELVSYQGAPAYEVALDRATLYVDAQSAAVLASSAAAEPAAADPPAGTGHEEHEEREEREHEHRGEYDG